MEINISRKAIIVLVIAALVIALGIGGYFAWTTWGSSLLPASQPTEEPTVEADPLTDLAIRYVNAAYTKDYQNLELMEANCQEKADMGKPCPEDNSQMLVNYEIVQTVVIESVEATETTLQITPYPTRIVHITLTGKSKDQASWNEQKIVTIIFDPDTNLIFDVETRDANP